MTEDNTILRGHPDYDPDSLHWYWAIFRDEPPAGNNTATGYLVTRWFDSIEEVQFHFREYDRETYRIHGVLRSDND